MPGIAEAIDSAARSLKGQAGIGGKIQGDSPPPGGSAPVPTSSPSVQEMEAKRLISQGGQANTGGVVDPADDKDKIIAEKERKLVESSERIRALEDSQSTLLDRMAELVPVAAKGGQPGTDGGDSKPLSLPDNFDDLSDDDKNSALINVQVSKAMATEREAIQKALGPIINRVVSQTEVIDRSELSKQFPGFEWSKHEDALKKIHAELPGSSLLERVKIVADPSELMPAARPDAPVTVPARPSSALASGSDPSVVARPTQNGPTDQELLILSARARASGETRKADMLADEVIKRRIARGHKRRQSGG